MTNVHESAQMKGLKRQRALIKGQYTRIATYLVESDHFDIHELEARKEKMTQLSKCFENFQLTIELEDEIFDHDSERDQFEKNYFKISGRISRHIEELRAPSTTVASGRLIDSPNTVMVRQESTFLPKIEIRPYDGNSIEWHNFHDTFKTLVHDNQDLPAIQKFHYLKNALRGEITAVISSLNASEPNYQVDRRAIEIQNITLADSEFHKPGKIDALLGNTLFFSLLSSGQIKLNKDKVILQKTRLGWIVTSQTNLQPLYKAPTLVNAFHVSTMLDTILNKFWEVEEFANRTYLSEKEKAAELAFKQGTVKDEDGRYCVKLPFNEPKQLLGNSREITLKGFYAVEKIILQSRASRGI
ncbi:hypothetical protein ANTQUA_LOCUS9033 [Anthophora quadrimaculata]